MITIRDAVEADVEEVARVHVQAWRESYAAFLSPEALEGLSVDERRAQWRQAFAGPSPKSRFLVAEENGAVVGFVRGGPLRDAALAPVAEAEIHAIYLLDTAKRRGAGRRLMAGVFDHLARQGFGSVGLWVLKENRAARAFYEALGGRPGPEQAFDLRGDRVTEIAYSFAPIPVTPSVRIGIAKNK
ncbi:MAG: GNAT family N-acetyltransferase [Microvirga sp.]